MDLWMIFLVAGVFIGAIVIYLLFMIFLPEWVGITGKVALEAEKSHRGDSNSDEPEKAES